MSISISGLGLLIRVGKGIFDAGTMIRTCEEVEKELCSYTNIDGYLQDFDDVEKIRAQNNLILAKYWIEMNKRLPNGNKTDRQILTKGVFARMDANLEEARNKLQQQTATMYHVALVLTGMQQIAAEMESQFISIQEEIAELKNKLTEYQTNKELRLPLGEKNLIKIQQEFEMLKYRVEEMGLLYMEKARNMEAELKAEINKIGSRNLTLSRRVEDLLQRTDMFVDISDDISNLKTVQSQLKEFVECLQADNNILKNTVSQKADASIIEGVYRKIHDVEQFFKNESDVFRKQGIIIGNKLDEVSKFISKCNKEIETINNLIQQTDKTVQAIQELVEIHEEKLNKVRRTLIFGGIGILVVTMLIIFQSLF